MSKAETIHASWVMRDIEHITDGRAEILHLSSSVEKDFTSKRSERVKYLSTREDKLISNFQAAL